MKIGYVTGTGRGETDGVLSQAAARLGQQGYRLAGLVQTNLERLHDHHCDMDVALLPSGPVFRISQTLGVGAKGCRLDPDTLERAVAAVNARLDAQTDLLILNKFGKHEAEGRGFRETIGRALEMGVPVLLGVNGLNHEAFSAFAGEFAERLDNTPEAILRWVGASHRLAKAS
jgi:nucleoside-triphosphatase THEP1